jgi:glutathione S-transferase
MAETPTPQAETPTPQQRVAGKPTLYICHGDEGGPRMHPCSRVQKALRDAGIEYEKVIAAKGNPIPFLRKGSREELRQATGDTKVPALKLPDGSSSKIPTTAAPDGRPVITHSRAILAWIEEQKSS